MQHAAILFPRSSNNAKPLSRMNDVSIISRAPVSRLTASATSSSMPSTMTSGILPRLASMLSFVDPEPHSKEAPHKLGSTVGESMSNAPSFALTERHSMLKPNVTPPLSF